MLHRRAEQRRRRRPAPSPREAPRRRDPCRGAVRVRRAPPHLGRVGSRRSERGRRGARGDRRRRLRLSAGANVRVAAPRLRAPTPRRPRRRPPAHRAARLRVALVDRRPVRQRRERGARHAVRAGARSVAADRSDALDGRQRAPPGEVALDARRIAVRLARLRLLRPPRRERLRVRRHVRPRRPHEREGRRAHDLGVGGQRRRDARLVERLADPEGRQVPRPRLRPLRQRGHAATGVEPAPRQSVRRRRHADDLAPPRRRERRPGRAPRGRRRRVAKHARRRRRRAARQRGRSGAGRAYPVRRARGVREAGEGGRSGGVGGVRSLPDAHVVRRSGRPPRARDGDEGRAEGADHPALAPRGRGRRRPKPARPVDREGRSAPRQRRRVAGGSHRRPLGSREPGAHRPELARRDAVLRAGPRARSRRRDGDARPGRAVRRGRPPRHGVEPPRSRARPPAEERRAAARDRRHAPPAGAHDRRGRDGRAVRRPPLRRSDVRPFAHRARPRAPRRGRRRAVDRSPRRDEPRQRGRPLHGRPLVHGARRPGPLDRDVPQDPGSRPRRRRHDERASPTSTPSAGSAISSSRS